MEIYTVDSLIAMTKKELGIKDTETSVHLERMRKVMFKDSYYKEELHGKVGIIRSMNEESECAVEVDNTIYWARESDLVPYTEPETEDNYWEDDFKKMNECFEKIQRTLASLCETWGKIEDGINKLNRL